MSPTVVTRLLGSSWLGVEEKSWKEGKHCIHTSKNFLSITKKKKKSTVTSYKCTPNRKNASE
jgi:hypothetical protein